MEDIYFDPNYGKLYEKRENGRNVIWTYESDVGEIKNQFILREIPIKIDEKIWHDIITPYGYGGPTIVSIGKEYSKEDLLNCYQEEFNKFITENNIVSEFIRFHPLTDNANDFINIYDVESLRHTLGTNLKDNDDPIATEFSKGCRKNIRKAIKNGVSWKITPQPEELTAFKEIYYSTMDRNKASDSYYFDDEYFSDCIKYFKKNIIFVEAIFKEKTIAAGFYFIYNKTIHIHLSGTLSEYLYLSPAYILRYAVTLWGKENGYEMIHHGGGRSNAEDDSLYLFKKQFAQNTKFDFHIGKKIWNPEIYSKLCAKSNADVNDSFFPAYRKE